MPSICRFEFEKPMRTDQLETQLALAIVVAECMFGHPRVRLEGAYSISKEHSLVVIDVSTEVGEFISRIFTGFLMRRLGEDAFTTEKVHEADRIFESSRTEVGKGVRRRAAQG